MLLQLPSDQLREQVDKTIRNHLQKPHLVVQPDPVPRVQVEEVSRTTLDTMLTRQYRVGPLPSPTVYEQLLTRVRLRVERNQKIRVAIGYGPLKNQNAVPYSRADWAEVFALCHLVSWHNKVQAVYAPGIEVRIVFDDSTLAMANRSPRALMQSYMESIEDRIRVLGLQPVFMPTFRQSWLSWFLHLGFFQVARRRVRRWERDPANKDQLERMHEFARRNLVLGSTLPPEQEKRSIEEAAHRYRVYWEALQLSGMTRSKRRVVAMYLDGSQHHRRQDVTLHLTTLYKGQVTQPWQGEGALLDNGHGSLEPFVLTAQRRLRYTCQLVEGLSIVPGLGFDRIAVARLKDEA
jgi:hypothetical protein